MKRAALFLATGTLVALPAMLLAQQSTVEEAPANTAADEPFPWPDFLEADPLPGGYRFTIAMERFVISGLGDESGKDEMDMSLMGEEAEVETEYYCVPEDVERFDLLAAMSEGSSDCTASPVRLDGEAFSAAVMCREPDGSQMRLRMSGTADETSMNALMAMQMKGQDAGQFNMDMRLVVERIGECSDLPPGALEPDIEEAWSE